MKRQPIHVRVIAALELQPMTVEQLAKCLSAHPTTIRRNLPMSGAHRLGTVRTKGRPWIRYGVPA